ncbi:MAG: 16S rRNA (guanine(527)-N(7))-methyltransferase RsmG [Lachnospiraceae bacterium]|nr:16S rRNA (guanine(527)-N(7))-methyltransferase RsmG [Lachnospiraceae bacterium]
MDILTDGLKKLDISYNDIQIDLVNRFYEMLIERNKVMNLTRITDKKEFYEKHILDSLLVCKINDLRNKKIIDIGTGAGFPGIPVKIFFPETDMVLLDSLNKRLVFIDDVINELHLESVITVHGRAEELGHDKRFRESFDIVLSRAVADLSVLSELCIPFVKINGFFISYKSSDTDEEILNAENAIHILSGSAAEVINIKIPNSDISRRFVKIKKEKPTQKTYPRKPGTPARYPL